MGTDEPGAAGDLWSRAPPRAWPLAYGVTPASRAPTGGNQSAGSRPGPRTGTPRATPAGARPSSAPWAGSTPT